MKKGLIYSRVSTEDQAKEGQSIEAQIRLCSSYAKDNNIQVTDIFRDEGKSASTTNRPGLKAMLEKATNDSGIECILVMDTDRIARNTLDHLSIKALIKKHNVQLISVSQPMIDDSPEGNFIDTVLASANALQSQITGRKTSKVMEQKIKAGWWANQAPLGYLNADNPKPTSSLDKRIIIPDPDRAPLITQMFKLYATSTYSLDSLTHRMIKLGFTSRNGQPLQTSIVHRILTSPLYYGKIPWKSQLYPGNHQKLIDKDTWLLCQDVLDNHNQHASRTRKHNYLLRGYLYCDDCGSRYWAAPHKGNTTIKEYYYCKNCRKGTYTDVAVMEKQAEKWFAKVEMTDKYSKDLVEKAKTVLEQLRGSTADDRQALVNRQTALTQQLETAETKLINGTLSDERYKAIAHKIESQITGVEDELDKLNKDYGKKFEGIKQLANMARNIQQTYITADPQLKRHYLDLFFDKLMVKDGKIIAAIPSKDIQPLIKEGKIKVRVTNNWLPLWEDIRKMFDKVLKRIETSNVIPNSKYLLTNTKLVLTKLQT